jgi:hypothetical protein
MTAGLNAETSHDGNDVLCESDRTAESLQKT